MDLHNKSSNHSNYYYHNSMKSPIKMGGSGEEPKDIGVGAGENEADEQSPMSLFYESQAYLSSLKGAIGGASAGKISSAPLLKNLPCSSSYAINSQDLEITPVSSRTPGNWRRKNLLHHSQWAAPSPGQNESACQCGCPCGESALQISRLRAELARVCCERDGLAIQVEQLRMEICVGELGRLDSTSLSSGDRRPSAIASLGAVGGIIMGQIQSQDGGSLMGCASTGGGESSDRGGCIEGLIRRRSDSHQGDGESEMPVVVRDKRKLLNDHESVSHPDLDSLEGEDEVTLLEETNVDTVVVSPSSSSNLSHNNNASKRESSISFDIGNRSDLMTEVMGALGEVGILETQKLLDMTNEIDTLLNLSLEVEGAGSEGVQPSTDTGVEHEDDADDADADDEDTDVEIISAHLIPQKVDDHFHPITSTYSSSEMTRLSSSSSSSASSSPVLFAQQGTQTKSQTHFHHDVSEDQGEPGFVDRRYGTVPARDAALVIQRAYRRYSMVKEFQRIKTERRLSRRINNNVVGSSTSPPVNSCDICIEVHPESDSHHHHHHPHRHQLVANDVSLEGLEDGLESPADADLIVSGSGPKEQVVTEVDVHMDNKVLVGSSHPHHTAGGGVGPKNLPPQYQYLQQHGVYRHQHQQQHRHPPQYTHPPTAYTNIQISHNNNRQYHHHSLHHQHSEGSSRIRHHPHHIPHSQSGGNLPHQHSLHYAPQNNTSAPGLLMVKTSSHVSQTSVQTSNGNATSSSSDSASASATTTPLTNVSPNLSTGSSAGGGKVMLSSEESEILRKRLYRVGLNLFNKKPEAGVTYLVKKKFLEGSPPSVARFLVSRKGLSKQMIGEYLTNLQSPFSMSCLEHFVTEIDLTSLPIDLALRKFQSYYRMPGEAQKIERLMESFSRRYGVCNPQVVSQFRSGADTVFVLAFAIIMLNTDLHTPHLKADRRMKLEDFIKNLRGVDDGGDIDKDILVGIYDRIKATEFKTGSDHVTQVMKVQQTIVGKKPNLAVPHRRLVCYCRLYEVPDVNKKEKVGTHQREVFLFNDILVLTKIFHKKRNSVTYSFRQSYALQELTLSLYSNQYFDYGLSLKKGEQTLLSLNARNEHDRAKFTEDLREAIAESDEMARIETLSKENRDSGVDVGKIKRFSNSLLDINDQCKPVRRGSCGSLDSGMSVSFQSDENHQNAATTNLQHQTQSTSTTTSCSSSASSNLSHLQQSQP